ncbi:hypothetical protein P280DRAFT_167368 [Massarina eburnea CBS 473.64]|uniref:Uncharacterized protein n=1 Tax=Massarina eburnea CBS 473.64 TaxID=1395130 RepID=A0A6A6RKT5_9PLEO|nr:hypothetical protein P280DRAFT_167368 [Massarina eburnea CBS 473.64]
MLILRTGVAFALAVLSTAQNFGNFTNSTTSLSAASSSSGSTSSRSALTTSVVSRVVITLVRNNSSSSTIAPTAKATALNATTTAPPVRTVTFSLVRNNSTSSGNATGNATNTATETNAGAVCNNQQISWSLASHSYASAHTTVKSELVTSNRTSTIFASTLFSCTRNCSTICYAGPTTVTKSTTVLFTTSTRTWTSSFNYPSPSPNCTIPFNDCLSLKSTYTTSFSSWLSLPADQRSITSSPRNPSCSACVRTSCTFAHAGMSLYFWPVTTSVSRDYCAWTPIGGPATGNNTATATANSSDVDRHYDWAI